jgi:hypothetical protein
VQIALSEQWIKVMEPFNYFKGWMDELRIWKVELTVDEIRQMMNQEIQTMVEMSKEQLYH